MPISRPPIALILGFLLVAAVPAIKADAIHYTIDSTILSTHDIYTPLTGSFDYDPVAESFSDFTVEWDGFAFDLTASANDPELDAPSTCIGASTGAAATFAFLGCANSGTAWYAAEDTSTDLFVVGIFGRDTLNGPNTAVIQAGTPPGPDPNIADSGTVTIVEVAPEPGSIVLVLIGLGLSMRKRKPSPKQL